MSLQEPGPVCRKVGFSFGGFRSSSDRSVGMLDGVVIRLSARATTALGGAVPVLGLAVTAQPLRTRERGRGSPFPSTPGYLALSLDGVLDATNGVLDLAL